MEEVCKMIIVANKIQVSRGVASIPHNLCEPRFMLGMERRGLRLSESAAHVKEDHI